MAVDVGCKRQNSYDERLEPTADEKAAEAARIAEKRKRTLLPQNPDDRFMLRSFSDKRTAIAWLNDVGLGWRIVHAEFGLCDTTVLVERVEPITTTKGENNGHS